ncbi:PREDICTED: mitochondrial import inner membrane translocase subunit Tim10 B, partial [Phaethon lepturus]|uniref:mitochondrial import inner membrane translocase subunit Tim10 B n=1 Tax=Phaethon lepturus TaxID=97097 RepID=UPI0005305550
LFQLRDFLLVYNRMTELCFRHCVSNLNYRLLTGREETCLDSCAGKLVHSNHRLMSAYVALMPSIMQRRISNYEASTAQASQNSWNAGAECPHWRSAREVSRTRLCSTLGPGPMGLLADCSDWKPAGTTTSPRDR